MAFFSARAEQPSIDSAKEAQEEYIATRLAQGWALEAEQGREDGGPSACEILVKELIQRERPADMGKAYRAIVGNLFTSPAFQTETSRYGAVAITTKLAHLTDKYASARGVDKSEVQFRKLMTHVFQREVEFLVLVCTSDDEDVTVYEKEYTYLYGLWSAQERAATKTIGDLPLIEEAKDEHVWREGDVVRWTVHSSADSQHVLMNYSRGLPELLFASHLHIEPTNWDALNFGFYLPGETQMVIEECEISEKEAAGISL